MKEITETGSYRRSLGLVELVSLGVGGSVGSGIFVVPGLAAGLSGPGSLIAWVIVALSALSLALHYGIFQESPYESSFREYTSTM